MATTCDPGKRPRWNLADRVDVDPAGGPTGVGTQNHCVHGTSTITEEIVDWKPYGYCTLRVGSPLGPFLMTVELDGDADTSRMSVRMRLEAGAVKRLLFKVLFRTKISKDFTAGMERLRILLEQDPPAGPATGGSAAVAEDAPTIR